MPAGWGVRVPRKGCSLARRTRRHATAAWRLLYRLLFMSVDTVCTLYQSFQDGPASEAKGAAAAAAGQGSGSGPGADTAGTGTLLRPCQRHMSPTERLRKMESLFGSLPEMLDFQRVFLQTLEERIACSPDLSTLETPAQFKVGRLVFLGKIAHLCFRKTTRKTTMVKTDRAFKEFLDARNPTKQHSSTLESYLIKPVQRVLKYPLLLRELVSLTDVDSEEHYHLNEALKAMEKVASHINEMQKLYEDYGAVFDQLVAEQTGHNKEVTEISMGEFLMHSSAVWLNPHPSMGRMRKDPEMTVFVFKRAVILVYREHYKLKKKLVRLGNTAGAGTETSCIWELIHTRSEVEGRPETIFQLCSSVPESKANVVKVMRGILRENVRRATKGTAAGPERGCKDRQAPLRSTMPSSARIGSSRASWLSKKTRANSVQASKLRAGPDSDESSQSSSAHGSSGGGPPRASTDPQLSPAQESWSQDSGCNSQPSSSSVKESDVLSDEDGYDVFRESGDKRRTNGRAGPSPTSAIEAQFLQLALSEEAASRGAPAPRVQPEGAEVNTPESRHKAMRTHYSPVKRKTSSSFRRSQGPSGSLKGRSRSLDSQADAAAATVIDINSLLEREFSVQSLTSVVNEDCFYDPAESGVVDSGHDTPSP
ncbi:hypothetical protein CRUP_024321 [Coryphaenoides rupestris]|nr:hypothetical protein CRUP_024321 [Coryphaenoides rupestris]